MIDEVSETLGWERKHTIKVLNGKVTLGVKAQTRGSKATHGEEERAALRGATEGNPAAVDGELRSALRSH